MQGSEGWFPGNVGGIFRDVSTQRKRPLVSVSHLFTLIASVSSSAGHDPVFVCEKYQPTIHPAVQWQGVVLISLSRHAVDRHVLHHFDGAVFASFGCRFGGPSSKYKSSLCLPIHREITSSQV